MVGGARKGVVNLGDTCIGYSLDIDGSLRFSNVLDLLREACPLDSLPVDALLIITLDDDVVFVGFVVFFFLPLFFPFLSFLFCLLSNCI